MKHYYRILKFIGVLLLPVGLSNCLPVYHLERFSARLLSSPGTVQIETGRKDMSVEMSGSFSTTMSAEPISNAEGSFYDLEKKVPDPMVTNCLYSTPTTQASFYWALLGKRLVCGKFEMRFGMIGDKLYYNFSPGLGVRLYKNSVAGRVWLSAGLAKTACDVFILERNENNTAYKLNDTYNDVIPFADLTLAFNMKSPALAINPFVNLSLRYYSLFRYQDIAVSLQPVFLTSGIYKNLGPFTVALALQVSGYETAESVAVRSAVTGQFTFHLR